MKLCQAHLSHSDGVLLMVSGGKDSMTLLNIFQLIWRHRLFCRALPLWVLHFNHKKRGELSDQDEFFVHDTCLKLGLPCQSFSAPQNLQSSSNFQEIARQWRLQTARRFGHETLGLLRPCIATAHHAQDQVETMLLNMLRGTGSAGLSGMATFSESLFKPLLMTHAAEIRHYIDAHNIEFRHDASNDSQDYKRNKIRHTVIPALRHIEPQFEKHFCQAALNLRQDNLLQAKIRLRLLELDPKLQLSQGQIQNVVGHILKAQKSKTSCPIFCTLTKKYSVSIASLDRFGNLDEVDITLQTLA